jgi:hypothetical protein
MPIFRGSKDATVSSGDIVATQADIAEALTSAQQAQAASEAAQAAAEAALDNFDDRYLGAKSSDPTVDNDGDPLIDGALYYNTVDNVTKIYDLGTTSWKNLRLSDAEQANVDTVAGIEADVTTVAGISGDVSTVSGISTDVTTVSGISGDVTTVADNDANVTTVADDIDNVNATADNIADVNTVAGISTDVTTVSDISSDVTTVAGIDTDVTTVSGIDSDVTTVSGISSDVTTVSGVSADVSTVAGISGDVTTVADNVADITNFSDVYIGPAASDPATRNDGSALQAGDLYFNTTDDKLKIYDGSVWEVTARDDSDIRSLFSAGGDLTYNSITGEFSFTERTDSEVRNLFSASGDLTYNSITGEFSVTVPAGYDSSDFDTDFGAKTTDDLSEGATNLYYADSLVDNHLSGGTGVTYSTGTISIGQDVGTGQSVTFVDAEFTGTGAVELPEGTEAQRPGTPAAGMIRFNSDAASFEGYDGSAWGEIGGSSNDASISISTGSGLTGGGTFTTDQSFNETISVSHADTSSQGSVNNSGSTVIQDVSLDGFGHVTNLNSTTINEYSDSDALDLFNATGSAPVYACRAWVNFDGTGTVSIRESGNVSSITDNGTGDYTVNFATAMPDSNYCAQISCGYGRGESHRFQDLPTNSSVNFRTLTSTGSSEDVSICYINVFR